MYGEGERHAGLTACRTIGIKEAFLMLFLKFRAFSRLNDVKDFTNHFSCAAGCFNHVSVSAGQAPRCFPH